MKNNKKRIHEIIPFQSSEDGKSIYSEEMLKELENYGITEEDVQNHEKGKKCVDMLLKTVSTSDYKYTGEQQKRVKKYFNHFEFRMMQPLYKELEKCGFFVNERNNYQKDFAHEYLKDKSGNPFLLKIEVIYRERKEQVVKGDSFFVKRVMIIRRDRIKFSRTIDGEWLQLPNLCVDEIETAARQRTVKKVETCEKASLKMIVHCSTPIEEIKKECIDQEKRARNHAIIYGSLLILLITYIMCLMC